MAPKTNTGKAATTGTDINLNGIEMDAGEGLKLQSARHYYAPEKSLAPDGRPYPIRGMLLKSEMMGDDRPFNGLIFRLTAPTIVGSDEGLKRIEAGDEVIVAATYNLLAYVDVANDPDEVLELWLRAQPKEEIKGGKQSIWPYEVVLKGRHSRRDVTGIGALLGTKKAAEELAASSQAS
jgi:hypothetical protein